MTMEGYEFNEQLPRNVRGHLSPQAQDVYRFSYNAAIAEGYDTQGAYRQAMQAVSMLVGKAYNPNEPRDPKGTPTGGQWTDGDTVPEAGSAEEKRLLRIAKKKAAKEATEKYLQYRDKFVDLYDLRYTRGPKPADLEQQIADARAKWYALEPEYDARKMEANKEFIERRAIWLRNESSRPNEFKRSLAFANYQGWAAGLPRFSGEGPSGDPIEVDDSATGYTEGPYFHGTTEAALSSIMQDGLKPGARGRRSYGSDYYRGSRAKSVYFTGSEDEAKDYSSMAAAAAKFRGVSVTPVVLRVDLPDSTLVITDEADDTAIRIKGTISPDWITSAHKLGENEKWIEIPLPKKTRKADPVTIYAVVFVLPEPAEKYSPDQPRAPEGTTIGGRWIRGGSSDTGLEGDREELDPAPADRENLPEHIKKLRVPPAWTNLYYNKDPDGELLVVGQDSKGRLQYVYSQAYTEGQMRAKFERIREMDSSFGAMRSEVDKQRGSADETVREHADVTALIMETGIRPGSTRDRGGAKQAYGATTLLGQHVMDNGARLAFTGKKGVSLNIAVENKSLARMLRDRANNAGADGRLFPNTSDASLRDFVNGLDGGSFSPKDFRTYVGTSLARTLVSQADAPSSFVNYKKAVKAIGKSVSEKLGNTPIIALQSYIDPTVFSEWRMGLAMKAINYDVWFGVVDKDDKFDWRKVPVKDPDDTELKPTPPDVTAVLGFDPREKD